MANLPCFGCGKHGALTGCCDMCDGAAVYCNAECFERDRARHEGYECELLSNVPMAGTADAGFAKTSLILAFASMGFPEIKNPGFEAEMDLTKGRFFALLPPDKTGFRDEVRITLTSAQLEEAKAAVAAYRASGVLRRRSPSNDRDAGDRGFQYGAFYYVGEIAPATSVPRLATLFLSLVPSLPLEGPASGGL